MSEEDKVGSPLDQSLKKARDFRISNQTPPHDETYFQRVVDHNRAKQIQSRITPKSDIASTGIDITAGQAVARSTETTDLLRLNFKEAARVIAEKNHIPIKSVTMQDYLAWLKEQS